MSATVCRNNPQRHSSPRKGVPIGGSTANLVRLLREAEGGKGLEVDYVEALQEALVVQEHVADSQKDKSRGRDYVTKAASVQGKRRKSRVLPGPSEIRAATQKERVELHPRDVQTQQSQRSVCQAAVAASKGSDLGDLLHAEKSGLPFTDDGGSSVEQSAAIVSTSDIHHVYSILRHRGRNENGLVADNVRPGDTNSLDRVDPKTSRTGHLDASATAKEEAGDIAKRRAPHSSVISGGSSSLMNDGKPNVPTTVLPRASKGSFSKETTSSQSFSGSTASEMGSVSPTKAAFTKSSPKETSFCTIQTKELTIGLGNWANEAVVIGRLLEEDRKQVGLDLDGCKRTEHHDRRRLVQNMGEIVKTLPLTFLKEHGYLGEAQSRGLDKARKALERQGARARAHAWQKWRRFIEACRWEEKSMHALRAAALCRGYMARRRVAEIRKAREEAARTEPKRLPLRRRLIKVSAASSVVASCVIANAANRRRRRARELAAAARMVERAFVRHKTKRQGWREIVQYQHEQLAAQRIQRWTRGTLVRRRVPLVRRIQRMEQLDVRFKHRGEVFEMNLVEHGAAVKIQKWWRRLPCRMRDLRACYRRVLDKRAKVIQRAYGRHLGRRRIKQGSDGNREGNQDWFGMTGVRSSTVAAGVQRGMKIFAKTGNALFDRGQARMSSVLPAARARMTKVGASAMGIKSPIRLTVMEYAKAGQFVGALGEAGRASMAIMSPTNVRSRIALMSPTRLREKRRKEHAAGRIQRLMRAKVASKRLLKKKMEREIKAAETMQRLVRVKAHNKMVKRQRALFEGVCRQAMYRLTAKGKAGEVATAVGRRWGQRRRYMRTRRWAISCQALVRGWIGRRRAESRRAYLSRIGEEREAGALRWEQLLRRREEEELLNGARSEDLEEKLELHRVFLKYCRFGDRRNNGRLQVGKLTALCKDAGIIDAKKLPVQRVELAFSRLKPKDQSHMLYSGFLAALDDLALQHHDIRKSSDAAAARANVERVLVIATLDSKQSSVGFRADGMLRPDDQRLLVLLQKYIMIKSAPGREACSELQAEGRGARQRALDRLSAASVAVQSAVARGHRDRVIAADMRKQRDVEIEHTLLEWAILLLQTRFRAYLAMTRAAKMALKRYYRCLDGPTGAEYYFDPKTGKSSWTKPKILGKFDIPTAVVMPTGDDSILVLMCKECAEEIAKEICADCDDMFCSTCATRLHRSANSATHLRVTIDMCDECQFQVATKYCKQCQDSFCRTCFGYVHRRGRLRRHTFDPMAAMCHDCGDRPQAQRCFGCDPQGQLLLCRQCQDARHAGLTEYDLSFHRCEEVGFISMKVVRMKEEIAAQARQNWIKAQSASTGKKKMDKKRAWAAVKIQAVYRGHLARRRKAKLIEQHLLWRMQRLRDDQVRKKKSYKFLDIFGKAPRLKSDTNQELVLKQYPRWWQRTIVDIIRPGVGWHEAAKMVREQDFFRKQAARRGRLEVLLARIRVRLARQRLRKVKQKEGKLVTSHERAIGAYRDAKKEKYRHHYRYEEPAELRHFLADEDKEESSSEAGLLVGHARTSGGVSVKHKADLQQAARKAKRAFKIHEAERQKVEAVVKRAEDGLEALIGPFRLSKTVRRTLKGGVPMPFPLSVQKGRGAAQVSATHSIREVQKWMTHGRRVRMEPAGLSSRPASHALRPFVVRGVKEMPLPRTKSTKSMATDVAAAFSSVLAQPAPSPGELQSGADGQASSTGSSPVLALDRQWVLPDAENARAFAMPVLPPLKEASVVMGAWLRGTSPVQLAVKAGAVAAHTLSLRLEAWQTNFDEDSAMYARLERWVAGSEARSASLMFWRRCLFDIEKGFEIERKLADTHDFLQAMWYRAQDLTDTAMSAAAAEFAVRSGPGGGASGTALDRGVILQLFKKWVRSDDREKLLVMHRSGPRANGAVELVGYVRVDLDTPTPVLREFIRRFCGGWLNENAKGERFLMENSKATLVRRSKEGGAGSATAMDMVQERLNKTTRGTEVVIFVQDEIDRKDPEAEVEGVIIPAPDLLDPEATPVFDNDYDSEEAKVDGNLITKGGSGDEKNSGKSGDHPVGLDDNQSSDGSMGSDVEAHEDDPFARMEQDEQDRKDEEAATVAAADVQK